jgi:hypothetical protein
MKRKKKCHRFHEKKLFSEFSGIQVNMRSSVIIINYVETLCNLYVMLSFKYKYVKPFRLTADVCRLFRA